MAEITTEEIRLHPSWLEPLRSEFEQRYMSELKRFLIAERERGKHIFPKGTQWFRALDLTPLEDVRVVILGQDPYHGEGQAHGLCFSVQPGIRPPPSLINIYKELESDLGIKPRPHGFLEHWAKQGVLLLNSVLTVEMGRAASHRERGWERFTDRVIREVTEAYEVLSNSETRALYDRYGHAGLRSGGFTTTHFDIGGLGDLFAAFFGDDVFGGIRGGGRQRGADVAAQIEIELVDIVQQVEEAAADVDPRGHR